MQLYDAFLMQRLMIWKVIKGKKKKKMGMARVNLIFGNSFRLETKGKARISKSE